MSDAFEVERIQPHYMAIEWDGEYATIKKIEAMSEHVGTDVEFTTHYDDSLEFTIPSKHDRNAKIKDSISVGDFVVYDSHKEEYSFHQQHWTPFSKLFKAVQPPA